MQDYNKAIEINPNYADAYVNRGFIKESLGDCRGAMQDYNKAIEIDPNNSEATYSRGVRKFNLGDYRGAIQDYNKAIEINPNDVWAYNNRGVAKSHIEDYQGAIQDYNKAIEIDPKDAMAYYNRGIAKQIIKDKEEACLDWSKAGELGHPQAYDLIKQNCNVFTINPKTNEQSPSNEVTSTLTYAGKIYHTIKIGNQTWLKENLDVGIMIKSQKDATDNKLIEKYCYDNKLANCKTYGGLYQWNEAMAYSTTPGTKGICPTGWHIPTHAEFEELKTAVNNDGNALKYISQGKGKGRGTNTSGFSAMLGGLHYISGFACLGANSYFWSSDDYYNISADNMSLWDIANHISLSDEVKENALSIRCLKD